MPSFISAAVAALSLSSLASANVAWRRQEASLAPFPSANSSSSSTQLSSTRSVPVGTGSSSIIGTPSSTAGSGSGSNSTTTATGTSPSTTASPSNYPRTFRGVSFFLEIDITYEGIDLDLAIIFAKRAGETLDDCLATCAANTKCVGTAFDSNDDTCSFFSEINKDSRKDAPGVTFATVTGRNNTGGNNSTSSAPINNGTSSTRGPIFPTTTKNGTSVTAVPNPGNNGTSPFPNAETIICPEYNDQVLQNADGSQYLIECGMNIEGTLLFTGSLTALRLAVLLIPASVLHTTLPSARALSTALLMLSLPMPTPILPFSSTRPPSPAPAPLSSLSSLPRPSPRARLPALSPPPP
jgi:hypothetical protein